MSLMRPLELLDTPLFHIKIAFHSIKEEAMSMKKSNVLCILCLVVAFLFGCAGPHKAEKKLSQKRYNEAIPLFKAYLSENPESSRARAKLGFAYLKTGRLDEAISELNTALREKPGDPYAILYLGLAYLNKEDIGRAIKTWQGYRDKKQPLVEEEIKRQLTLLQIKESHRVAKRALLEEGRLRTVRPDTRTIAVTYYRDLSPDKSLRAFQKALTAMVISDLSKIKSLKVVERVHLQALLDEMRLGQTGIVDRRTAPRVGRLLGAENLVIGSLALGSIRAVTSMTSTSNANITGSTSISVQKAKFFDLPKLIVENVANMAGINLSPQESKAIGIPHTKNYKALIYFGRALDALDAGNWKGAKALFTEALKEDPAFALAKEGMESCPGASSPSISALISMTIANCARGVETAINATIAAQAEADTEAKGAAGDGCLAYDTLVLMADNTLKRVIDLRAGEIVKGRDIKTGEIVERKVSHKYRADEDHYYLINGELKITKSHPLLTGNGKWVMVADLKVGDSIASIDGLIKITSFEKVKYDHRVYFLGVEDTHNYFVSAYGKNLYTVHNDCGGGGGK